MIWPMRSFRGWCRVVLVALVGCTGQPTKEELLDSDGDGSPVGEDCDDTDAPTWYADADGDGYGDVLESTTTCTQPEGTVDNGEDCDDGDAEVNRDAAELCDGVDNDCDGVTDEDDAEDAGTWHADVDGDGYGDTSDTTACTQPEGTLDNPDDCDDGDPTVYPGAAEVCGDGVVNDCDGEAAIAAADCGLAGRESLASAALKLVGEVSGDWAGLSVAGAGDVDGDGRDDLVVGAPQEGSVAYLSGAAYLMLSDGALASGSSPLYLSEADVKLVGEDNLEYVGTSVAGAGDVNGDGRDDLLLGAHGNDAGGDEAGAAYLMLSDGALSSGSSPLDLSEADIKFVGEDNNDYAGFSVAGPGDVDGDGRDDLLVGAHREETGGEYAGAAYLLLSDGSLGLGSSPLDLSEADVKLLGGPSGGYAGYAVSGAGDVDGDGRGDLLVGAPTEDSGGDNAGAVYLLLSDGALASSSSLLDLSEAEVMFIGEVIDDQVGYCVSKAGDVDGDGRGDLLLAAPFAGTSPDYAGATYLVLGDGALASSLFYLSEADLKLVGEGSSNLSGHSASGAGDVNGDGRDDLLVGALGESSRLEDAGAAYLLLSDGALASGSSRLNLSESDVKLVGEAAEDGAGVSVSGAGDVDGDGFSDLLVGAYGGYAVDALPGAAYLLYGGVGYGVGY